MLNVLNSSGEIIDTINPGDRIMRKNSIEHIETTTEINKGIPFVKCYLYKDIQVGKCLTGIEVQVLMYLINFISYGSCLLTHDNGKVLTSKSISSYFDTTIKWTRNILNSLVNKQILSKSRTGRSIAYIMNPYVFSRGKRVSNDIVKLFENTKWAKRFNK